MTDAAAGMGRAASDARKLDAAATGPMLAADGRPLKASLNRALRAQKLRALALIAPLLLFILAALNIAPDRGMGLSQRMRSSARSRPRRCRRIGESDDSAAARTLEAMYLTPDVVGQRAQR